MLAREPSALLTHEISPRLSIMMELEHQLRKSKIPISNLNNPLNIISLHIIIEMDKS